MKDLSQEIIELAKQHFPQVVAGELKIFIEEAVLTLQSLVETKRQLLDSEALVKEQTQIIMVFKTTAKLDDDLREKDKRLNNRENELDKREMQFKLELNEAEIKHIEASKLEVFGLVRLVFGHPNVKVETVRLEQTPVPHNMSECVTNHEHRTAETVTTTEGKDTED